jgi:uncharacterized protein
MLKEIILEWNPWWNKNDFFKGITRDKIKEVLTWLKKKEIIAIFGVRRSGKTTLMYQLIDYLLNKIDKSKILFIKSDDDRINKENLIDNSIKEYQRLINPSDEFYLFIDEIQELDNWDKTLKRIYDLNPKIKIIVSGSNSSILKDDLAHKLAGRFAYFEIFPFDFSEFISLKNVTFKNEKDLLNNRKKIINYFIEYITYGAFPEVVLEENKIMKKKLINYYFDSIFYRDVIKRKNIRNPEKMEKLVKFYLQNISCLANYSKIGKIIDLTTDSITEYTKYLDEAYLIFNVNIFAHSYKKQIINPKKIYCVDLGIRNILGFNFSEDYGKLYENLVFLKLRKENKEIYYWKSDLYKEIDFVIKEGKTYSLIQSCYSIKNDETKNREINALIDGMQHFKTKNAIIITEDYENVEKIKGNNIKFIPLWKWLL